MVNSEKELAQLELERAQLRSLIDTLPDLVWLKDPDGVYLACNELFGQFYGAPTAEILGRSDYDFTDPEQAEFFRQHDLAAIAAGKPTMNEEWITYASDGHRELLETIKTPMFDDVGNLIGVLGIGRNITQRDEDAKRLQRTIDTVEALIVQLDAHGRVTLINQRATSLLGGERDFALGLDWYALSAPLEEAEHHREQLLEFMRSGVAQVKENEITLVSKNAGMRTISWVFRRLEDASGQVSGCLCAGIDITRRLKEREQARLASMVFQQAQEAIMVCDTNERIIQVNPSFSKITGFAPEEVLGQTPRCLASGRHEPYEFEEMWNQIAKTGSWSGELWNRHRSGSHYLAKIDLSVVLDELGRPSHYVSVFTDVTVIRSQNERLRALAHFDSLTGLPNRTLLQDRLDQALARSQRDRTNLAVCFLDLDKFKPVNDTYGHNVGDELLIAVANRLRTVPREADTVARQGGDEFVVILNDVGDEDSCRGVATRMLEVLEQPFVVSGHTIEVHASIGIAMNPHPDIDGGTLLRRADQAMYQAKILGRNQLHFFDAEADMALTSRVQRLAELKRALQANEVELFYQPNVCLNSGDVLGFEALLRWANPVEGMLSAGAFLPQVRGSALEADLDQWVLGEALKQVDDWRKQGVNTVVSVNISASTLQRKDFVSIVQSQLDTYPNLPPSCLTLEVVESDALGDMVHVRTMFEAFRDLGVQIALDDFGTGYSSLTYFRRLPVDVIKIDRSFVTNMNQSAQDLAIVSNVTNLARAFGRTVIAEGVEDQNTARTLHMLGCESVQGFGIARPMPANSVMAWMRSRTSEQPFTTPELAH